MAHAEEYDAIIMSLTVAKSGVLLLTVSVWHFTIDIRDNVHDTGNSAH